VSSKAALPSGADVSGDDSAKCRVERIGAAISGNIASCVGGGDGSMKRSTWAYLSGIDSSNTMFTTDRCEARCDRGVRGSHREAQEG